MKPLKHLILSVILLTALCSAAAAESVLIVNNSVKETIIKKEDVKLVFLGKKKKWNNGDRIRLCALKRGPRHEAFLNEYMDKTPSKFSSFWKIAIVSGTALPPKFFESEAEVVDYVKKEAGAIGYISAGTLHEEVKVLDVK